MKNNYATYLNDLINFGISKSEELTYEERRIRMDDFRSSLSYEKYESLFLELENFLLNEEVSLNDKDITLTNLLEFIRCYPKLEDNIQKFPITIQKLYQNFLDFKRILVFFDLVNESDITRTLDFEFMANLYLDFLNNPEYELFIHINYSKIEKLNKDILNYFNKTDFNGIKNIDNINNQELINVLKDKMNDLKNNR